MQNPSTASGRIRRAGELAIVLLFLVIIAVPGLGLALGLDRTRVSESEMRELAEWPAWSWSRKALIGWPDAFQTYFEDHFTLRNWLINRRASFLWHRLGTTSSDTVIGGKQDWLFYGADGSLDDWIQLAPFSPGDLEKWRQLLVRRRASLARRGIPFLFVIAPDKQMIYPEYMPDTLRRLRDDYRADQLIAYMARTTPDYHILDLRPALLAAKPNELLYHRYDNHWNDRGGLIGYQVMAEALRQWFPDLKPLQRGDFDTDPSVASGDRTTMLGLRDEGKLAMPGLVLRRGEGYRIVEPEHPDPYGEVGLLITEHRDRSLPKAIVYRDSFAGRLIPFLSEHFSHASYLWENELDFPKIEKEQPDIVIQEFVARHLFTYEPFPETIPD